MRSPVIEVRSFSKSFGRSQVIQDLSFEVYQGEVFAFLGANGSGKTTTLRCLLGIYEPSAGELLIKGQPYTTQLAHSLGYLPEERGLYTTSRVLETMVYFGQLKGLTAEAARRWSREYLERVELSDKEAVEIKKLSSGQQQKIQLGITIINQPDLLILDEPTKGLDPVNRDLLMEMLLELNKRGSTIIFSTHQMEEAEKIADRLLMIKNGELALYGSLGEVKKQFGSDTIRLRFSGQALPVNPKLYEAKIENKTAEITPKANITPPDILKALLEAGVQVEQFELGTPSLHQIFVMVSRGRSITKTKVTKANKQ